LIATWAGNDTRCAAADDLGERQNAENKIRQ
jgi:hypothetical protein